MKYDGLDTCTSAFEIKYVGKDIGGQWRLEQNWLRRFVREQVHDEQ